MKKLRNGIQQQERALGLRSDVTEGNNGLSPVALFYPSLLHVDVKRVSSSKQEAEDRLEQERLGIRRLKSSRVASALLANLFSQIMGESVADPSVGDHVKLDPIGSPSLLLDQRDERSVHHQCFATTRILPVGMLGVVVQRIA